MFDRLYQENWLEQVTTKKGLLNWSIASLCLELVAKMAKDIGMTIRNWYCGTIPTLFGCFLKISSLYVLSFFKMFFCYFLLYIQELFLLCKSQMYIT